MYAVVAKPCRNLLVLARAVLARPCAAGIRLRANEAEAVRLVAALAAGREEVGCGACSDEAGAEAKAVRLAATALAAGREAAGCGACSDEAGAEVQREQATEREQAWTDVMTSTAMEGVTTASTGEILGRYGGDMRQMR